MPDVTKSLMEEIVEEFEDLGKKFRGFLESVTSHGQPLPAEVNKIHADMKDTLDAHDAAVDKLKDAATSPQVPDAPPAPPPSIPITAAEHEDPQPHTS